VNRATVLLATLALASTVAISADAKITRTGSPTVTFNAAGPAGMKIVGTTNDLDVDDQGAKIVIRVPLRNLATGIALRDDHMRNKYLQIGTYPNAELTVDRSALHFPTGDGIGSGDAPGSMAIHGHSKNVTFHYNLGRASGSLHVSGTVHLDVRDYSIDIPSYLGVTVKPEIDVEVQFTATE
jgi:polyisoprenoid-binding protein YceI